MRVYAAVALFATLLMNSGCFVEPEGERETCEPYARRCNFDGVLTWMEMCGEDSETWLPSLYCPEGCSAGVCYQQPPDYTMPPAHAWDEEEFHLPPQAEGTDEPGVTVRRGLTLGTDALEIEVEDGVQYTVRAGTYYEPKHGEHQRLIVVEDHVLLGPTTAYVEAYCMQAEKIGLSDEYFSTPKAPDGSIQECQESCGADQLCIWACQGMTVGP